MKYIIVYHEGKVNLDDEAKGFIEMRIENNFPASFVSSGNTVIVSVPDEVKTVTVGKKSKEKLVSKNFFSW